MTSPAQEKVPPEQYAYQQQVIVSGLSVFVQRLLKPFQAMQLGEFEWLTLLELLYPRVEEARRQSSENARLFFDSQRLLHFPVAPVHPVDLAPYTFDMFVADMEPARRGFSRPNASESDAGRVVLQTAKITENAGRRTMIRAVTTDDYPEQHGTVKGWARVATGRETCSWCLMLVSRGPVYMFASTAGIDLDDTTAAQMVAQGADMSEYMNQWHAGCDCKVVPVYSKSNWVGRDEYKRAEELWVQAHDQAQKDWDALSESEQDATTFNRVHQNAYRRLIERGGVDLSIFGSSLGGYDEPLIAAA